jgi:hypothetical protein
MKLIEDGRNFGKKSIEMELTSNKNYTHYKDIKYIK